MPIPTIDGSGCTRQLRNALTRFTVRLSPMAGMVDLYKEKARLTKELADIEGQIKEKRLAQRSVCRKGA